MNHQDQIEEMIEQGAMFYISHSGGKDSQAMYSHLSALVPPSQITVVHADLGEVEWMGVQDHINATVHHPVNVVRATWKDGSEKNLLNMIERRFENRPEAPSFPSSAMRYCTSDLKRDPIHKFIRNHMKDNGLTIGVNCTGLRSEESSARAKKETLVMNKRLTIRTRTVWEWLPIHNWTTEEVFAEISAANQEPFWAYSQNERLSCVFCIMGSVGDLQHGAKHRPELFKKLVSLEVRTGWTMFAKQSLEDRTGIIASSI